MLNAHPEFLTDPYGPRLAVQEMEDAFRKNGGAPAPAKAPAKGKGTIAPARDGAKGSEVVELTREQREFAEFNQIPLATYAKALQQVERGEVQVP